MILLLLLSSLGLLTPSMTAPAAVRVTRQIEWLPTLDAALEQAKRDGKPLFIAINMDGERANDEVIRLHYKEPGLLKLAGRTAALFASKHDHGSGERPCPRSGVVTCAQHMRVEIDMRKKFLQTQEDSTIAPQHLWVDPDGKVIHSVPYRISTGEMEWCFANAIRAVDPEFNPSLGGSARAPRRLVVAGVVATGLDPAAEPPTKKEVAAIIEELRKARRPWDSRGEVLKLMLSPEKKAIEYVQVLLTARSGGRGGRGGGGGGGGNGGDENGGGRQPGQWKRDLIHEIGRHSPPPYWAALVPLLSDNDIALRREVSVALEQLAEPKALAALTKQFRAEEETDVRKELIRAIASCGRDSSKAQKLVTQNASKAKDELLRINAMIAAASLEDRQLVVDLARSGLLAGVGGVRAAAGYVIGIRRELELRPQLEAAIETESDSEVRAALERALAVLDGGEAAQLDPILRDFARSDILRDRP